MRTGPETAMVLAAGLGTRMRPLTEHLPKPLIEVAGKPLIDHALDALQAAGVVRAVVNVHYRAAQLEAHLHARAAPIITISDERACLMETGGALVQAAPLLGRAPIFVTNTDQVFLNGGAPGLEVLKAGWRGLAMDALLLLAPAAQTTGYAGAGDFFLGPDGRVAKRGTAPAAPFVYTGVQILSPRALDGHACAPFSLNRVWDASARAARLFGVVADGLWMHVGDPEGRAIAEARLQSGA